MQHIVRVDVVIVANSVHDVSVLRCFEQLPFARQICCPEISERQTFDVESHSLQVIGTVNFPSQQPDGVVVDTATHLFRGTRQSRSSHLRRNVLQNKADTAIDIDDVRSKPTVAASAQGSERENEIQSDSENESQIV